MNDEQYKNFSDDIERIADELIALRPKYAHDEQARGRLDACISAVMYQFSKATPDE